MKKIMISASLALATLWCAYAQEPIPQEEEIIQQEETMARNSEGRQMINEMNVPSAVQEGFINSEFQGMSIVEVYELSGEALEEIPTLSQEPKPDRLYELVVEDSSRSAILYFTEEGKLYDFVEKV